MSTSSPPTTFTFPSSIRVSNESGLRQAAIFVLHAILFHRVFGTLQPISVLYNQTEFPVVAEAGVMRVVKSKADELVKAMGLGQSSSSVGQIVVSLYDPSSPPLSSTAAAAVGEQTLSEEPGAYRYGWLAQAFAGGIAGPTNTDHASHPRVPMQPSGDTTSEAPVPLSTLVPDLGNFKDKDGNGFIRRFETWKIVFHLTTDKGKGRWQQKQDQGSDVQLEEQLVDFLEQILHFVDEEREHIPLLPSSDLCPFPIVINVGAKPS